MKFPVWIEEELKRRKSEDETITKTKLLEVLAKESGVSTMTVHNASKGMKLRRYDKAKALSKLTEDRKGRPKVTVEELCE